MREWLMIFVERFVMRAWSICLAVCLSFSISQVWAGFSPVSRAQLQGVLSQPGNVVHSPAWETYQGQPIRWQGQVYKVDPRLNPNQVDVLVKVLPNSPLYDTILVVPASHPWATGLKSGQRVVFSGQIKHAVDNKILRAVQVELTSAEGVF